MSSLLYTQVPLEDPRTQIRLLTILPRAIKDVTTLRCDLHRVDIANPGEYEGLSYQWLGPMVGEVYINNISTVVSKNLFNALLALRRSTAPRVLWVDALCIDQAQDDEDGEKGQQLHLMRQIYQNARQTIAWFGLEAIGSGGTHILADFLDQLSRLRETVQHNERWAANIGAAAHFANEHERRQHGIPDDEHTGWKTLAHLVTRSWTKRVWVIQEVAVARSTTIQCGPYCFSMEDVAMASSLMWTLGVEVANNLPSHFRSTWGECSKHRNGQRRTLLSLVIRHWLSDATRAHDKVYALCGLASDSGPDGLDIRFDYRKSVDEVYTDFARSALLKYRNLDLLSALAPFNADRSRHIPSWVPDWRVFNNGTLVYRRPEPPPERGPCLILFTAARCTASEPLFSECGRRLRMDGHILDVVSEVGALRPLEYTAGEIVDFLITWRNKIARCSHKKRYAPTGQLLVDVYYHTMTMGNLSNFLLDPLKQYRQFDHDLLTLAKCWKLRSSFSTDHELAAVGASSLTPNSVLQSVVMSACRPSVNRRMVRTKSGYLGLVHGLTEVGDRIAIFRGGSLPLVIRKQGNFWRVIGDSYIHGVMMGEAFQEQKCEAFWFT